MKKMKIDKRGIKKLRKTGSGDSNSFCKDIFEKRNGAVRKSCLL